MAQIIELDVVKSRFVENEEFLASGDAIAIQYNVADISGIQDIVIGGVTYGTFTYTPAFSTHKSQEVATQDAAAITALANA